MLHPASVRKSIKHLAFIYLMLMILVSLLWLAILLLRNSLSQPTLSTGVTRESLDHEDQSRFRLATTKFTNLLSPQMEVNETTQARVSESYGKLPLSFEANWGQTNPQVKFLSRGSGYSLF